MAYAQDLAGARAGLGGKLRILARDLSERYARHRLYRRTVNELRSLSSRELADLGLHRSMITRVAWQAAYGK
ncbi:MAG: DUF1127 domain-containing protein [Paracoccaceae bacterium]